MRLLGAQAPTQQTRIETKILSRSVPSRQTRVGKNSAAYRRAIGLDGFRVVSYRVISESGRALRREQLGDDTYAVMNDVTMLSQ